MNLTKEKALDLILDVMFYAPVEEIERACYELELDELLENEEEQGIVRQTLLAATGMTEQDVEDAVTRLIDRL